MGNAGKFSEMMRRLAERTQSILNLLMERFSNLLNASEQPEMVNLKPGSNYSNKVAKN